MRFGPDDKFWVVVDPTPVSELGDVLFETTVRGLELQFKGGLAMAQTPTIFTDPGEAEREARRRLLAAHAAQAVLRSEGRVERLALYDGEDKLILEAKLEDLRR